MFLSFLTLQESANIVVFAITCNVPMFPLNLGFPSGDTEIISMDQDSATGNIFIAYTTTAPELRVTGASKSVIIALFNGIDYTYIKRINDPLVDNVEFMSAMGSSSPYLVLYVTRSGNPYIPLILTINKTDGSIVRAVQINDQVTTENYHVIGNVNPPSKQSYRS